MLRVMPFASVLIGRFSLHPKRSNSYNKTARKLQPTLSRLAETACKSLSTHLLHVSFKGGKQDTTMTAQNKVPLIWKEKSHPTRFRKLSIDTIEIKSDLCFPLVLMKSSQICVLWGLVLRPITMQSLALNPLFLQSLQWLHTFQAYAVKRLTTSLTYTTVEKENCFLSLLGWLWFTYGELCKGQDLSPGPVRRNHHSMLAATWVQPCVSFTKTFTKLSKLRVLSRTLFGEQWQYFLTQQCFVSSILL